VVCRGMKKGGGKYPTPFAKKGDSFVVTKVPP